MKKLLTKYPRLTALMIANELHINRESVRQIVTQNLGMRKACCLVPHHLTNDRKQVRLEASQDFIETADATQHFLNCIVTEDESWCLRRNGKAWNDVLRHHFVRKGSEQKNHALKKRLIPFFDSQGIIYKEFLPEGTTVNTERHLEISTRFMKRLRRARLQYVQQGSWFFVHDKARPHTANIAKQFLAKKVVGAN